jgi:hypothetical protein
MFSKSGRPATGAIDVHREHQVQHVDPEAQQRRRHAGDGLLIDDPQLGDQAGPGAGEVLARLGEQPGGIEVRVQLLGVRTVIRALQGQVESAGAAEARARVQLLPAHGVQAPAFAIVHGPSVEVPAAGGAALPAELAPRQRRQHHRRIQRIFQPDRPDVPAAQPTVDDAAALLLKSSST